jgi:hypothetical protein
MTAVTAEVNGIMTPGFVCDDCGHFHSKTKKSPRQLDAEIAEALSGSGSALRVGQLFDRLGHIYEVTKIGRDKLRTIQIARRVRDLFGKETLIDHHSFPLRDRDREYMKPIDLQTAQRRGWPQLVK